jgi:hypothetical protein
MNVLKAAYVMAAHDFDLILLPQHISLILILMMTPAHSLPSNVLLSKRRFL